MSGPKIASVANMKKPVLSGPAFFNMPIRIQTNCTRTRPGQRAMDEVSLCLTNRPVRTHMAGGVGTGSKRPPVTRLIVFCTLEILTSMIVTCSARHALIHPIYILIFEIKLIYNINAVYGYFEN